MERRYRRRRRRHRDHGNFQVVRQNLFIIIGIVLGILAFVGVLGALFYFAKNVFSGL
jgi:hypothetical protein